MSPAKKSPGEVALIATVISIIAIPVIDLFEMPDSADQTRLRYLCQCSHCPDTALLIVNILFIRRALASNIFIKLMVAIVIIIILSVAILGSVNVRSYRLGLTEYFSITWPSYLKQMDVKSQRPWIGK